MIMQKISIGVAFFYQTFLTTSYTKLPKKTFRFFWLNDIDSLLKFDYINTSGTDVLKVLLSTDGGFTFTQVGANLGVQGAWGSKEFQINSSSANTIIRLQAVSDFGTTDIGIDNLSVIIGCSGTPVAGTATASPTSVCYGGSTTINVTGATSAA